MDGIFNKFLSVLKEVTEDEKQFETSEKDKEEGDDGDKELKTIKQNGNNLTGPGKEAFTDVITEKEIYSENEPVNEPDHDEPKHEPDNDEAKHEPVSVQGSSFSDFLEDSLKFFKKDTPSEKELNETSQKEVVKEAKSECNSEKESESDRESGIRKEEGLTVRVEQCIDVVPVEEMPDSCETRARTPVYTPSLAHSPTLGVLQRDKPPSPSLFDRSVEFLKREFDTLRYTLGTRPVLSHEEWFNIFNSDGQMLETELFYNYLLEYDWPNELLQEGWKYLFEYYETFSNHEERVLVDRSKENEMEELLKSWSNVLEREDGDEEKEMVKKLIYLINKDVPRTDRDHEFYTSNPENSDVLRDLLVTFCFTYPDIGYVQGMNEVLSMFLVTVEHRAAAYWGFSNYVLRNKLFFNSTGLMAKLNGVAELLNIHDPELYRKLKLLDCSNMLFCQRWILLGFKRECKTFDMAVKIFTTINSLKPTHYIQLQGLGKCELLSLDMFLVISILISSRATLLSFTDLTDVYQWVGKLKLTDMTAILHARQMYEEWAKRS